MKRRIYRQLLEWKRRGAAKPLLVLGARQVGKTYVIKEFCRREFAATETITLSERPDIVALFAEAIPTERKVKRLQLLLGHAVDFESTVLFFDEVQVSEDFIESLKFFAEDPTPYQIICAGSLLGVSLARFSKSFPVGKVELLRLAPMDFPEYLSALGQDALWDEILQHSAQRAQLPAPLHEHCLDLYRCYLWVGGMPEAVANLIAHDIDPLRTDRGILDAISESYLADMSKHILTPMEAARIQAVYRSLPSQLGNASRKFQYAEVRAGARARDYASALSWLVASEIVRCVTMVSTPTSPLRAYERDGFFKLFLNDTGLLCQLAGVRAAAVLFDHDMPFRGAIAENYVACQLAARGVPLFYWRDDNNAEIDFVMDTDEGVIPLEVKAGIRVKSASLEAYRSRFDPPYVIRFSTRNFGSKGGVVSLPLYAAASLCPGSEV